MPITLHVSYPASANRRTAIVCLQGDPSTPLTPALARRAAQIAHGHGHSCTVSDLSAGIAYRLYPRSHRKLAQPAPRSHFHRVIEEKGA